jgi:hypothetical protein
MSVCMTWRVQRWSRRLTIWVGAASREQSSCSASSAAKVGSNLSIYLDALLTPWLYKRFTAAQTNAPSCLRERQRPSAVGLLSRVRKKLRSPYSVCCILSVLRVIKPRVPIPCP